MHAEESHKREENDRPGIYAKNEIWTDVLWPIETLAYNMMIIITLDTFLRQKLN